MPHSFSNCPLRSSSLLIAHHTTQSIVTATDDVLDLLGYSMSELLGQSMIQSLQLKLSPHIASYIPECTIQHANGSILHFQVCVHQDPLGGSSCLDYWLIKLLSTDQDEQEQQELSSAVVPCNNAISVIRLSPYGTIEQVQPSPALRQPVEELMGRPIMAFIYQDDVEPLCSSLSNICSTHKQQQLQQHSLFIRWSTLSHLLSTSLLDHEDSLNYDWMSFTLMANQQQNSAVIRPICILRPLQIILKESTRQENQGVVVIRDTLFDQIADQCNLLYQVVQQSANHSKAYLLEFYHHLVSSLLEMITAYLFHHPQQQSYCTINSSSKGNSIQVVDNQQVFQVPLLQKSTTTTKSNDNNSFVWNLIKSNSITQTSLSILEFTGILDHKPHFKSYFETLSS